MKLDKTFILEKISTTARIIKRYRFVIVFAIFSIMYGYILLQVNAIDAKQPNEDKVSEQATSTPRTKVDPKLAEKIILLEEQNVQIKTLFNQARDNPFDE